jgi:hypothetical protein
MNLRPLKTYLVKLSARRHYLLLEALLLLLGSALLMRIFHFERLAHWLQLRPCETPPVAGRDEELLAVQIGWAIAAIANRAPGSVKCLTRALAASLLARRRGLRATLYLGVTRGAAGDLQAHAWSRCGSCLITGKTEQPNFTPVAWFSFRESSAVSRVQRTPC